MRILVVEDNRRLAELICEGLLTAGYVTDAAHNMCDAELFLRRIDYNLIVLDISLPDGCGADLLRSVRRRGQSMPVLVVTARMDTPYRVKILEEGADDYLGKPFEMDELIARARAILRRPPQIEQSVLRISNVVLDCHRLTVQIDCHPVEFPRREVDALAILLRNGGRLVPRGKLEEALYSLDEEVTPNALEAVVSRLRKRLDQAGAAITLTAMRGLGYILSERM